MPPSEGIVQLRRARENDALGIAMVHVETWQEAYRGLVPDAYLAALKVETREEFWARELHGRGTERRPWVAEAAGELIAFAAAGGSRDEDARPDEGEVYAIYVRPSCWTLGVGSNLLAHAERDLREHGYLTAILWVLADNERACRFYEHAGWSHDGGTKVASMGGAELTEVRYRITLSKSPNWRV